MSGKIIDWKSGQIPTVGGATATICESDDIPDGASVTVCLRLQGRTAAGLVASCVVEHRGGRTGGVLALVGALTALLSFVTGSDGALAGAVAIINVNGSKVRAQVTGVVGQTITWFGDMRVRVNVP